MSRREERAKRDRDAAALRAEYDAFRARLLAVLARTDAYADELLTEIKKWNARGEHQ